MRFTQTFLLAFAGTTMALAQSPPPLSSIPRPPIASTNSATSLFRRILGMSNEEREKFLAESFPERQSYLRGRVQEYLALSPAEREKRLQALEVRAVMLPLMRMPANSRAQYLETLPVTNRAVLQERLSTWDILPPPLQKEVLSNETAIRYFIQLQKPGASKEEVLTGVSPERRQQLEVELNRLSALSQEQRDQMIRNFERFFGDDPRQREKTLRSLSETDRAIVQPTLVRFGNMPAGERESALEGYKKFKALPLKEQEDFLRNAARWQQMTEQERRLWRQIVLMTRPPVPPLPMPMPPPPQRPNVPPAGAVRDEPPIAATNR
jgi:hypothetical protein